MADNTSIEWTDATWNPVVGCSIVSPGCTNCYAMREAHRLGRNPKLNGKYAGLTRVVNGHPVWTGEARLHEAALLQPLTWRKPRRIFVNSMSDLFHEAIPDAAIDKVFAVMALCPQHTFQVLTKRSARMRAYFERRHSHNEVELAAERIRPSVGKPFSPKHVLAWPLRNVWLGVSAEDQPRADERIPDLRATPAAVRFVSAEPLLGAIDLDRLPRHDHVPLPRSGERSGAVDRAVGEGVAGDRASHPHPASPSSEGEEHDDERSLDWVIAGGESGPSARPAHPDWIRSLRDQCTAAAVPFFFKQWGEWSTGFTTIGTGESVFKRFETYQQWVNKAPTWVNGGICLDSQGKELRIGADFMKARDEGRFPVTIMHRIGKSKAPAQIDGRTWREFPAGSAALRAAHASLPGEAGEVSPPVLSEAKDLAATEGS